MALLLALLAVSALLSPVDGSASGGPPGGGAGTAFSLSLVPLWQFETDVDGGDRFAAGRFSASLSAMKSFPGGTRAGLSLGYALDEYDFSGPGPFGDEGGWGTIHRLSLSMPLSVPHRSGWLLGVTPILELAGEKGADAGDSFSYGGVLTFSKGFSRRLFLGLGAGLFERIGEFTAYPYVLLRWHITERLRVSNPFPAGPAGAAGLELVYSLGEGRWEAGIGGAYRSFRFRLEGEAGQEGPVGENRLVPLFLRFSRQAGPRYGADLYGGVSLAGRLVRDAPGEPKVEGDYDPALFIALVLTGRL